MSSGPPARARVGGALCRLRLKCCRRRPVHLRPNTEEKKRIAGGRARQPLHTPHALSPAQRAHWAHPRRPLQLVGAPGDVPQHNGSSCPWLTDVVAGHSAQPCRHGAGAAVAARDLLWRAAARSTSRRQCSGLGTWSGVVVLLHVRGRAPDERGQYRAAL